MVFAFWGVLQLPKAACVPRLQLLYELYNTCIAAILCSEDATVYYLGHRNMHVNISRAFHHISALANLGA